MQAQETLLPPPQFAASAPPLPPEEGHFDGFAPEVGGLHPWELQQENIYGIAALPLCRETHILGVRVMVGVRDT